MGDDSPRLAAKGHFDALARAKQVGGQRKVAPDHVFKEQRRAPGGNHAPVNLGGFEVGADRGLNADEVTLAVEAL